MPAPALALIFALLVAGTIPMVLLWIMGSIRVPMVMRGEVRFKDMALSREPWPEREKRVSRAFDNQFELPVLFYLGGAILLYFGPTWFEVAMAWAFVLSRIAHAAIFAIDNHVPRRFAAYVVGFAVLAALWLDLFARAFMFALGTA